MPDRDDIEIGADNLSRQQKGIEYKPDVDYDPEDIGLYNYIRGTSVSLPKFSEDVAEKSQIKLTLAKIDFLIEKCEEKLSKYEGFNKFRDACIKKNYCQQNLSDEEKTHYKDFRNMVKSLPTESLGVSNVEDDIDEDVPQSMQNIMNQTKSELKDKYGDLGIDI